MNSPDATRIGGKYEVLRELGAGGSATVYLARELATEMGAERLVAIKLLRDDGLLSDARLRFSQEIRVMANLRHPHAVPLFDAGIWDGRPYLVMPFIEGESLALRLRREGRLTLDEVLTIGLQMCDVLGYAHTQHLVHRDVKPSNILFDSTGHAWLADFGVARWTELTGDLRPTRSSAGTPGTPAYASPEQVAGDHHLDGRSDLYSLGVVLFEALTGALPFADAGSRDALARKLSGELPSLRSVRPDIPTNVEQVLQRFMAADPAHRWPNAAAASEGLRGAIGQASGARRLSFRPSRTVVGWAAGLAAVGAVFFMLTRPPTSPPTGVLDHNRIAIFPIEGQNPFPGTINLEARLHDALSYYADLSIADLTQADEAAPGGRPARVPASQMSSTASQSGAGRYVQLRLLPVGQGVRAELSIYRTGERIGPDRRAMAIVPVSIGTAGPEGIDGLLTVLADSVLFGAPDVPGTRAGRQTRSARARQLFLAGHASIRGGDFASADSALGSAVSLDPGYASAELWWAQLRAWRDQPPANWSDLVKRAAAKPSTLSARERTLATALASVASGGMPAACSAYRSLLTGDRGDFVAWFGLGECQRRDRTVVRDARSPSGWYFRSSLHAAIQAYQQAFALVPRASRAFLADEFDVMRKLLYTRSTSLRVGQSDGADRAPFGAMPSWDMRGDTLAFVPYPLGELSDKTPPTVGTAVIRNRALLADLARRWVEADRGSVDALAALAAAQEHQGDTAAIVSLDLAIGLSKSAGFRRELGLRKVMTLVRLGLPSRPELLRSAAVLADSLLAATDSLSRDGYSRLAGVAVLRGRVDQAMQAVARSAEARVVGGSGLRIPATIDADVERLNLLAVTSSSPDSLREGAARIRASLRGIATATVAAEATGLLLSQAAILAFANLGDFASLDVDGPTSDLLLAQRNLQRRDVAAVRRAVSAWGESRRNVPGSDVSLDAIYAEARLLEALGDLDAAAAWLDSFLQGVRFAPPDAMDGAIESACLLRAIEMRVSVATRTGQPAEAARWSASWNLIHRRVAE